MRPSTASVKRTAGSAGPGEIAAANQHAPRSAGIAADPRGDRAQVRTAAHQPRHAGGLRRECPAFLGEPAGRGHPHPVHGRGTHAAERRTAPTAPSETPSRRVRLCGSISARSVRRGSARNHTGASCPCRPVRRQFQPLAPRRRRQLRLDAARVSASSGRWKVWCMASAAGRRSGPLRRSLPRPPARPAPARGRIRSASACQRATAHSASTAATGMHGARGDARRRRVTASKATTGTSGSGVARERRCPGTADETRGTGRGHRRRWPTSERRSRTSERRRAHCRQRQHDDPQRHPNPRDR